MASKLLNLFRSESFWRYIDAFSPRLFALVTHTLVIAVYGKELYGALAWVVAAYGLWIAAVPDPHSYLLVRGHGPRAERLGRLMFLVVLVKSLMCGVGAGLSTAWLLSPEMTQAIELQGLVLLLGAATYGASEFLWTFAATASFAADRLIGIAKKGLYSRLGGLVLAVAAYYFARPALGLLLVIYSAPTLAVIFHEFRPSLRLRRVWVCYLFAVKNYALWSQLLGLSTTVLAQLLPTGAGMLRGIGAKEVGELAYATRILSALTTPFQVLQNILVKAYVKAHRTVTPAVRRYQSVFLIGALLSFFAFTGALAMAVYQGAVSLSSFWGLVMYGGCTAFYTWQRYTLTLAITGNSIRDVVCKVYLPLTAFFCAASVPAGYFFGVYGIALSSGLAWCALGITAMRFLPKFPVAPVAQR